jgi:ElaB/YqjD/DUF883 family membrane-anchored ribosome-binding protein
MREEELTKETIQEARKKTSQKKDYDSEDFKTEEVYDALKEAYERSFEILQATIADQVRTYPGRTLAIAAGTGYLLGRSISSSSARFLIKLGSRYLINEVSTRFKQEQDLH